MSSSRYGIAIDLGTTTIVAALVDTGDGRVMLSRGGLNPQRCYGLDVIARLEYASRSREHLLQLRQLVNAELEKCVTELLAGAGVGADAVALVAIAGNPAMSHLLLGLPVDSLSRPPYRPQQTGAHRLLTGELDWSLDIPLYVFPSPGGFVGGDTIAFLYGLGLIAPRTPNPEPALFLDLGTNGEIALLADGKLSATSAAAGPAFEGGNLSCGMAALPGAIDAVATSAGRLSLHTLADRTPSGICGSGVLDVITLLLNEGLLDATGGLRAPEQVASPLGNRLRELAGERHFVLYRDAGRLVSLSQTDIRQVQLAKGAVRAGMEVLFHRAGIDSDAVATVVITGSFGASLSLESLKSVGVLTGNMVKNARFVREGALAGVVRLLASHDASGGVERLAESLLIIPLSGTPLFERYFLEQINFPSKV